MIFACSVHCLTRSDIAMNDRGVSALANKVDAQPSFCCRSPSCLNAFTMTASVLQYIQDSPNDNSSCDRVLDRVHARPPNWCH